jgi:hypothetical protein
MHIFETEGLGGRTGKKSNFRKMGYEYFHISPPPQIVVLFCARINYVYTIEVDVIILELPF